MKVLHVLNSRIYSGAEKVVSQIIKDFEKTGEAQMVYCSPESDMVARMLAEQGIPYINVDGRWMKVAHSYQESPEPHGIHHLPCSMCPV